MVAVLKTFLLLQFCRIFGYKENEDQVEQESQA